MSKHLILRTVVVLAVAVTAFAPALAAQRRGTGRPRGEPQQKPVQYAIVKIDAEYRIVRKDELKSTKKQVDEQHQAALKAWTQARKEAVKEKRKFTEPRPKKPVFKVLGSGFKSEEEARARADKLAEKDRKKAERKRGRNG